MGLGDKDRPAGRQPAFSHTRALTRRLIEREGLPPLDVGMGVLAAAFVTLGLSLSRRELAELMYRFADHYAAE